MGYVDGAYRREIYGLNGWGSYGKVTVFRELKKHWSLGEYPFCHHMTRVSIPLNSWPMVYYRKGGTTPSLSFALRSPAFGWHTVLWAFTVLWIFKLLNKLGVGFNGWSYHRGVGKRLMYGIPACYRVICCRQKIHGNANRPFSWFCGQGLGTRLA